MAAKRRQGKGSYGRWQLPVARRYLVPGSRGRRMVLAAALFALILAAVAADFRLRRGKALSKGALSSHHALQEQDCASCHVEFDAVSDDRCSSCHEKFGDQLGVYTFAAHYLYRSTDFQRVVASEHELPCSSCHLEHAGREAQITRVPDSRCLDCHEYGAFGDDHPEFAFAREEAAEAGGLHFPHIEHIREVMAQQNLHDVERSCLYCHRPEADGRSFQPIEFDLHCDSCHLTTTTATPRLPIAGEAGEEDGPGVETLEAIRARGGPGTEWAYYTNPNEFRRTGPRILKSPLHHEDPWILDNLRRLRRELYPDAGLADLLTASPDAPVHRLSEVYGEAIATLQSQVDGLRARPEPEIQRDLAKLSALLTEAERSLLDPYTPLDETEFQLALERPDPNLSAEQVDSIDRLADELTTPCRQCHIVENATLARVQTDQRTLLSAEFDHRAHILQRRCLDCHREIPVLEHLNSPEPVDPAIDNAGIHNLPRIEACRECHQPRQVSDRCVTCHVFHPDKNRRSELLLYLETG